MLQTIAQVADRRFAGASQELVLHAPALASQLAPGQPVLVRAGWGREPYLRRALYPIEFGTETFTLRLTPGSDLAQSWLAAAPAGASVDCLGPVGHGFTLEPGVRNLLCLGEEQLSWALLPLVTQAAAAGLAITLAVEAILGRDLIPAPRLPPTVEYHVATINGSQPAAERTVAGAASLAAGARRSRLVARLPELLPWADAICAAGSPAFYDQLFTSIQAVRFNPTPGFAQVLYPAPILCGTGACQACTVDLLTGRRRACLRGPVFDLLDLRR